MHKKWRLKNKAHGEDKSTMSDEPFSIVLKLVLPKKRNLFTETL